MHFYTFHLKLKCELQTIRQLPHLNCRYSFALVAALFCAGLAQYSSTLYSDWSKNTIQISLGATLLTSIFSKPSLNNLGKFKIVILWGKRLNFVYEVVVSHLKLYSYKSHHSLILARHNIFSKFPVNFTRSKK